MDTYDPLLMQGWTRFEAQWITKQAIDSSGELDPDKDEYGYSQHATRERAEHAAITASKKTQVEWILVAEQKFIGRRWEDQRRWTGDWDGLHCETFNVEEDVEEVNLLTDRQIMAAIAIHICKRRTWDSLAEQFNVTRSQIIEETKATMDALGFHEWEDSDSGAAI